MAPNSVAAVNIDDTAIHSALHIPVGNFRKYLAALNDKMRL